MGLVDKIHMYILINIYQSSVKKKEKKSNWKREIVSFLNFTTTIRVTNVKQSLIRAVFIKIQTSLLSIGLE